MKESRSSIDGRNRLITLAKAADETIILKECSHNIWKYKNQNFSKKTNFNKYIYLY